MIEKLDALGILDGSPNALKSYLTNIAGDSDDYVSAGALYRLLDNNLLDNQNESLLMSRLHFPCVRRAAVLYFLKNGRLQAASDAVEYEKNMKPFDHARRLQFAIDRDMENLVESEAALFLENGQVSCLFKAASYAREYSGESGALPWMIRATLIMPKNPKSIPETLELLKLADNLTDLERLAEKLVAWDIQPVLAKIYSAHVLLHKGNLTEFNKVIRSISVDRLKTKLKAWVYKLIAEAKEKEGDYREASNYYFKQNSLNMSDTKAQKDLFMNKISALETLQFEGLPPVTSANHIMMLGFPRSGTTLLENALACHPQIETFEETDTFRSIGDTLLAHAGRPSPPQSPDNRKVDSRTWHTAIAVYEDQLRWQCDKKGASIFIDKMPMQSAYAGYLARCFPDKRYIFSIRHPYDVVLSCYKQNFSSNPAMEHFKRFDDACAIYDLVMKRWFTYFTRDDPRVCYISYDTLVEEFRREVARILEFLGLQWNDDVMNFAEMAQQRRAVTPSYSKVRQGLGLGVQSSWEKYDFLYTEENREHLDHWVSKFGYEGI